MPLASAALAQAWSRRNDPITQAEQAADHAAGLQRTLNWQPERHGGKASAKVARKPAKVRTVKRAAKAKKATKATKAKK